MKIAVPVSGERIDSHFGHCDSYRVFETTESRITGQFTIESPQGCGCKSNIAAILAQQGVAMMLAGNMGEGAYQVLNRHGIQVIRGCSGNPVKVVEDYLQGLLSDSNKHCEAHHSHDGQDGHRCAQH